MLGVHERPQADPQSGRIQPLEAHGLKFLSMGLLIETGVPVIWRGPMLAKMINQFLFNTDWGELDIVFPHFATGHRRRANNANPVGSLNRRPHCDYAFGHCP